MAYASDLGKMLSYIWKWRQKQKTAILPCETRQVYTFHYKNLATLPHICEEHTWKEEKKVY